MNLQDIREHAMRLNRFCDNIDAIESQIQLTGSSEYYSIFGNETERAEKIKELRDLQDRSKDNLASELRLGILFI